MKKLLGIFMVIMILLVGCGDSKPSQTISFPSSEEHDAFDLTISLPENWRVEMRSNQNTDWNKKFPLTPLLSTMDIYNDKNEIVGGLGYQTYPKYEEDVVPLMAIYSGIALGNDYNFNARPVGEDNGYYEAVKTSKNGVTAVTKVYYIPHFSKNAGYGEKETYNKGILSYHKNLLVYVGIELDDASLDDEALKAIAESIVINKVR